MANVTLKVSKSAYEAKINKLQDLLNRLDREVTDYQTLKTNMSKFIDGKDDNYETMCENVDTNIAAVRKAKEMCEASIKVLQETLKNMDDMGRNIKDMAQNAVETAKNVIGSAMDVANIIS